MLDVVRRHLLEAGGDAPHRLDLRLRGCPVLLTLRAAPFALPTPFCLWALSSLPVVARVTPSLLSPRSLPCTWSLAPVHPLASAALSVSHTVPRRPSAAARASAFPVHLPPSAAARFFALPVRLPPPPAAACAFARSLHLPPTRRRLPPSLVCPLPPPLRLPALCPAPYDGRLPRGPLPDLRVPWSPRAQPGPRNVVAAAA